MTRLIALIVSLIAMVATAITLAQPASADYYGSRFAEGNRPICVSTGWIDNTTLKTAVKAAAADWSNNTKLDVRTRTNCKTSGYRQRIWVLDAYYNTRWIGLVDVTHSWWGDSPTDGPWTADGWTWLHDRTTLKFNLSSTTKQSYSKVLSTATHEIGHALGLNHVEHTCSSVMTPDWDCWRKTTTSVDRVGTTAHPGVNLLYAEG